LIRSDYSLRQPVVALSIGFAAFLLFTGGGILDPRNVDWLLSGDPAQSWLGWQFFRHTPWLQWPLGANPDYGMEIGSSIVFSDSIPLLAFAFKPLSPWLPAAFQYFGGWLAACFMLQSLFAWKLLRQAGLAPTLALLGATFFAMAPAMTFRLSGHYALTAHWLVLAAIYLYFRPRASAGRWTLLLGIAVLVHAYLLVMVMALFAADLVQRAWKQEWRRARALAVFAAGAGFALLLMWATGYFMLGGLGGVQVDQSAFATYGMNLHALVDPESLWSNLLPDRRGGIGEYEGFAFPGLGMLLLGVVALPLLVELPRTSRRATWVPITAMAATMAVFALSNRISLGTTELASFPIPAFAQPLTGAFRVAGRFAWPAYYLLFLGLFVVLARGLRGNTARILLAGMLLLQLVDGDRAWRHFQAVLGDSPGWHSPMHSGLWEPLARQYRTLAVALPRNLPANWVAIGEFASRHGMRTHAGSFARINEVAAARARDSMAAALHGGGDPSTLYVVVDDPVWVDLLATPHAGGFLGVVDGFRIFAPAGCAQCDAGALQHSDASAGRLPVADAWSFQAGSPDLARLARGWSNPEPWGTWSDGDLAELRLDLVPDERADLDLVVTANAFVSAAHPLQRMRVSLDGTRLASISYSDAAGSGERRVRVPHALAAAAGDDAMLRFEFEDATSPAALGQSSDGRRLALGIISLRVEQVPSEPSSAPSSTRATP
jgi:hypothetical protein